MTLPFRRRHNDAEASHDRARSLIAAGFIEPLEPADTTWLEAHLAGCSECSRDAAAYEADRQLLRSLRDRAPEPPRDLWARTAAEIERSAGRRDRSVRPVPGPRIGRVPLGVLSGVLVVLVVVGAALAPRGGLPLVAPGDTNVARASVGSEATPIAVDANALAWIQVSPDGTYEFLQADVDEVCADARDGCAPLNTRNSTRLNLPQAPQAVLYSAKQSQLAVVTQSTASAGSDIVVVSVPTAAPTATLPPTSAPAGSSPPPPSLPATPQPTPTSTPTAIVTPPAPTPSAPTGSQPVGTPAVTIEPSASPEASSGHAIVSGVIVVGDAAYSDDGTWLAFSARPADGSTGPDLYSWHVGDDLAKAITVDHRTFFAGWLGNQILANRVEPGAVVPAASGVPGESGDASSPAVATPAATASLAPAEPPTATGSLDPNASPAPSAPIIEDHPSAFIVDPLTDAVTPLAGADIWRPTVDPTRTSVVYWSGTLVPDGTGHGWSLGTGHLVIDGWHDTGSTSSNGASPSPGDDATAGPTDSPDPSASPSAPSIGPAGSPINLTDAPVTDFDAWFDPGGTRLAVWLADPVDQTIGTLSLVVLDPDTRQVDVSANPLPGVSALRGVSINAGRLAWVTPPGQDGQGSHVQVLAWSGHDFGQVRTIQGDRFLVAR